MTLRDVQSLVRRHRCAEAAALMEAAASVLEDAEDVAGRGAGPALSGRVQEARALVEALERLAAPEEPPPPFPPDRGEA